MKTSVRKKVNSFIRDVSYMIHHGFFIIWFVIYSWEVILLYKSVK